MGSFNNSIIQLQQLQSVSSRLRRKLLGDARSELAAAITDHLLVFGNTLYHLESGNSRDLSANHEATEISSAAKQLLSNNASESGCLKLFLAPSEFVATITSMPGVSEENLTSALTLQRDALLPAYEKELALATPSPQTEEHGLLALWMPHERLTELFNAFSERGLLLAIVQPRIFCALNSNAVCDVLDDDGSDLTLASHSGGTLLSWLPVKKDDLEEDAFNRQWQESLEQQTRLIEIDRNNLRPYLESNQSVQTEYCFYPDGAIAARKKVEKSRQLILAASVLAGILLVAALPFLLQSLELRMANASLAAAREMSSDARADQRIVVDFENEWGTINDFPDQQVRQAMFRLQEVLGAERLSSLELNEGLIRIQGTSSNPQAILQQLEQDPLFTEVVFSRATNNTRYYIDLRLATVNFEAYMLRYFPDQS